MNGLAHYAYFYTMFDPVYWLFMLPPLLLAAGAKLWIGSSMAKYGRIRNREGITGAEAARRILDANGLTDVEVRLRGGWLSDHYDPGTRTVNLSQEVFHAHSVAAGGIAAHEVGHATQHSRL